MTNSLVAAVVESARSSAVWQESELYLQVGRDYTRFRRSTWFHYPASGSWANKAAFAGSPLEPGGLSILSVTSAKTLCNGVQTHVDMLRTEHQPRRCSGQARVVFAAGAPHRRSGRNGAAKCSMFSA